MNRAFILSIIGLFLVGNSQAEELAKEGQVEQSAKTAQQVVAAPLPAGDEKLAALRARMEMLRNKQTDYAKALAEGRIKPFPEIQEAWPSYQEKTARVSADTLAMEKEEDPAVRAALAKGIYSVLQEIGPYLKDGDYLEAPSVPLSEAQVAEINRLESLWNQAEQAALIKDKSGKPEQMVALSPMNQYTIKHLAVSLAVKVLPGSKVYFHSADGGEFSNGLLMMEAEAGEDGVASVLWVSHGRGVGPCQVGVRAPGLLYEMPPFHIRVVKPELEAPAYLTSLEKPPEEINPPRSNKPDQAPKSLK